MSHLRTIIPLMADDLLPPYIQTSNNVGVQSRNLKGFPVDGFWNNGVKCP